MIKEPLNRILSRYYHVETYDTAFIKQGVQLGIGVWRDVDLFLLQLREAIDNNLISLSEYEYLSEEDFDSQEDLTAWLEDMYSELIEMKKLSKINHQNHQ